MLAPIRKNTADITSERTRLEVSHLDTNRVIARANIVAI